MHSRSSLSLRSVRPFLHSKWHDHTDSLARMATGDTMRRYIELVRPLATEAQLRETQRLAKVLHWSPPILHCECLKPPVTATERRRSRARSFGGRNSRVASALNSTYPQHASRSTREHARRRGADVAVPFFQAELLRRESDLAKAAAAQGTPPPTRPPAHPPTRIYRPGSGHLPAASPQRSGARVR